MSVTQRDTTRRGAGAQDRMSWQAHWAARGQPWRIQPEITPERRRFLAERRAVTANIIQSVYPFRDIALTRADVEWLIATQPRNDTDADPGLDLRGADLRRVDLSHLPLRRLCGSLTREEGFSVTEEHREAAAIHLERASLRGAELEGAILWGGALAHAHLDGAHMEGAELSEARLEGASLRQTSLHGAALIGAHLDRADLTDARLDGADLTDATLERADLGGCVLAGAALLGARLDGARLRFARLQGRALETAELERLRRWAHAFPRALPAADIRGVSFNPATDLYGIALGDPTHGYVRAADVRWGDAILTVVAWSQVRMLGDEREARQPWAVDGTPKSRGRRIAEVETAIRANRQLAIVLQAQGLAEQSARFNYRAQVLQRQLLAWQVRWGPVPSENAEPERAGLWQTLHSAGAYLFSLALDVLSGYGARPGRLIITYLATILAFAVTHFLVGLHTGKPLTPFDALAMSIQNLHGRVFAFQAGDPQRVVNTAEAMVGLFVESLIVAVITRRILGLR